MISTLTSLSVLAPTPVLSSPSSSLRTSISVAPHLHVHYSLTSSSSLHNYPSPPSPLLSTTMKLPSFEGKEWKNAFLFLNDQVVHYRWSWEHTGSDKLARATKMKAKTYHGEGKGMLAARRGWRNWRRWWCYQRAPTTRTGALGLGLLIVRS